MDTGFHFQFMWSDEDVLQLRVRASNGGFGGTTDVYVPIGGLVEAARTLEGFPRSPSDTRELEFGEFGPEMAGGAISLRFYCTGAAGRAFVEATVESDHGEMKRAETAHFCVGVEGNAIDAFVSGLRRMETERGGTAHLNALVAA